MFQRRVYPTASASEVDIGEQLNRYGGWLATEAKRRGINDNREEIRQYIDEALKVVRVRGRDIRTFAPFRQHLSAFQTLTHKQVFIVSGGMLALVLALWFYGLTVLVVALALMMLFYVGDLLLIAGLALYMLDHAGGEHVDNEVVESLADAEWPRYTILCPLYHEAEVVPQFVQAMQALDYPSDKLEILLLTEESDSATHQSLEALHLPAYFTIVTVPEGQPRTKPRACNYGLMQATGQYVVVYDAEDIPDPLQLKKAVLTMANHGPELGCVQAKLNFYNTQQNLLTRWFTAEYSAWFDLILPGLEKLSAPFPLGGTSNHFRASVLRALGGWDAFNVTEDCDLGLRMGHLGFKMLMLDSTTYEEANSRLKNWIRQRSRWIKGYIQTYLVYMRHPQTYMRPGHLGQFLSLQLIVGGKTAVLFLNPVMWALSLIYILFRPVNLYHTLFPGPVLYTGALCLIFGNIFYMYLHLLGCMKRGHYHLVVWALFVPLNWLLASAAGFVAVRELLVKPHHWHKTMHGLHLEGRRGRRFAWGRAHAGHAFSRCVFGGLPRVSAIVGRMRQRYGFPTRTYMLGATHRGYPISVQVTSEDDPGYRAPAGCVLTLGSGALDLDVQPVAVSGQEATFRVAFLNQSQTSALMALTVRDSQDGLDIHIVPTDPIVVPAGATAVLATVHVRPKARKGIGWPHAYEIEFRGRHVGREQTNSPDLVAQARFTYVPRYAALRWTAWLRRLPVSTLALMLSGRRLLTSMAASVMPAESGKVEGVSLSRDGWFLALVGTACLASVTACWYYFQHHEIVLDQDAVSHMRISRGVFDSATPGLAQLGSIWLPLPHILMWPFIWNNFLWYSGLAGSFVSMPCFVISAVYLFLSARRLTHSSSASFIGTLLFILNPNVLYLQSTPMTELVCMATFTMSAYYFLAWAQDGELKQLVVCAGCAFLATLARYDGWGLFVGLFCAVPVVCLLKHQKFAQVKANLVVFSVIGCLGIVLWLLWNKIIFGDPFYFEDSMYALPQWGYVQDGTAFAYHNLWQAIRFYTVDSSHTVGIIVLVLAAVGVAWQIAHSRLTPSTIAAVVFLMYFPFYVAAQYKGNAIIWIPGANPPGTHLPLYDVRFGAEMAVPAALFVSIFVAKVSSSYLFLSHSMRRGILQIGLIGVIGVQGVLLGAYADNLSLKDAQGVHYFHFCSAGARGRLHVTEYLIEHYDGGRILEDVFTVRVDPASYRGDFKSIIYQGSGQLWLQALHDPVHAVEWILVDPTNKNDLVAQHIDVTSPFFLSQFRRVAGGQNESMVLYHRKGGPPLPTRPAPPRWTFDCKAGNSGSVVPASTQARGGAIGHRAGVARNATHPATSAAAPSTRLLPTTAPSPNVLLDPNPMQFGQQEVRRMSAERTMHVVNLGTTPLTVTRVTIGSADLDEFAERDTCTGATIAAYQGCMIRVRFTPVTRGIRGASLVIGDSSSDSPQTALLRGEGVSTPARIG